MAHQVRSFVLHLATNVNVYQLVALGLALGAAIMGMPSRRRRRDRSDICIENGGQNHGIRRTGRSGRACDHRSRFPGRFAEWLAGAGFVALQLERRKRSRR